MRKIITSSVLILLFTMISGQAYAGKVEACELIKHDPAYKGLYGLCNAYWNANEKAQDKILAKFTKKAGPGGPGMPGLGPDPEPEPEPEPVECPCWTAEELADSTVGLDGAFCANSVVSNEAVYDGNIPYFYAEETGPDTGYCVIDLGSAFVYLPTDAAETQTCRAGVQTLQNSTHDDGSSVFPPCFEF